MSKRTLDLVGDLIRQERNRLNTRWRQASSGIQAVIVLAVLRHDQRLADMAGGNAVSASTVRRWVMEVIRLLSPVTAPGPRTEEDRLRPAGSWSCWTAPSSALGAALGRTTGRTTAAHTRPMACCFSR
ncbi:hypothetical protein ABZV64_28440 [Streptomyces sp. NPDC004959]|uniref:hypothetical protein n=1 Tax=unclassified Streptomyces TaxID=2593676 RepID=UPI0018FE7306|nr:hypothetical protein [Streptomyces sp. NRRL F-5630]